MSKSPNHLFALPAADLDHVRQHAAADLEALRGKRLFLTGGTGFFGKWLLAALHHANTELELGIHLTILSRDPAAFLQKHPEVTQVPEFHFIAGQLADSDLSLPADPLDYIIHAGTDTSAISTATEEEQRAQSILCGTNHMLALLNRSGAKRMLNISSGAVYGTAAAKPSGAEESDATIYRGTPVTAYGKAKLEAERICESSGLDVVTARAFAFLGPWLPLDAHFAAGNFLRDAIAGGPILVRGDGTALRSYLHPADLVIWLLRILIQGKRAQAYNVGSNETVTTAQLAQQIANAVQPQAQVTIQSLQPQGPQNIYLPNITRAQTELGLQVQIPHQQAIRRTLDFLKSTR